MNVKKATFQIRKEQWMKTISDRIESGLSVRKYCSQCSINEATYYYWLKKIREDVIEKSDFNSPNPIVPMIKSLSNQKELFDSKPISKSSNASIVITTNVMKVEFSTGNSNELLLQIIRELKNA
jgi:hypothetical protein